MIGWLNVWHGLTLELAYKAVRDAGYILTRTEFAERRDSILIHPALPLRTHSAIIAISSIAGLIDRSSAPQKNA